MAHRTFKIATVVSTVMLAISVVLFLVGYIVSAWNYHLTFSDDFHIGVWQPRGDALRDPLPE